MKSIPTQLLITATIAITLFLIGAVTTQSAPETAYDRAMQKAATLTQKIHNPTYRALLQALIAQKRYFHHHSDDTDHVAVWTAYVHSLYDIDVSNATAKFQTALKAHIDVAEKMLTYEETMDANMVSALLQGAAAVARLSAERSKNLRDFDRTWAEVVKAGKDDNSTPTFNAEDQKFINEVGNLLSEE